MWEKLVPIAHQMPLLRVTNSGKCVCQKKWKIMRETSPVVCYCFARKVVSFNFSRWVKLAKFPPVRNSFVFARYKTRDTRQSCSRPSRRRRRKSQNKKKSEKSDSLISCHRRATNTLTPGCVHNRKEEKKSQWPVRSETCEPRMLNLLLLPAAGTSVVQTREPGSY